MGIDVGDRVVFTQRFLRSTGFAKAYERELDVGIVTAIIRGDLAEVDWFIAGPGHAILSNLVKQKDRGMTDNDKLLIIEWLHRVDKRLPGLDH